MLGVACLVPLLSATGSEELTVESVDRAKLTLLDAVTLDPPNVLTQRNSCPLDVPNLGSRKKPSFMFLVFFYDALKHLRNGVTVLRSFRY